MPRFVSSSTSWIGSVLSLARKTLSDLKSNDKLVEESVESFKSISEIKYELAKEAYDIQDKETKAVIDRIVSTLQVYASGTISVQLSPPTGGFITVKIDNTYLGYNLLWLAMEIVKDLAILGIRVESFEFPPSMCAVCGADVIPEKRRKSRG